ncbi:hypothetical protein [Alteromonas flava]|uniref:hypothetical protein n=1 Tax=Alteromonas flava TaxID=2048003 RepID=UPI001F0C9140|nr:hypothetical protein [Alteromonas flava]
MTRIKHTLYRAGQNPVRSWQRFKLGLGVFAFGLVLLIALPATSFVFTLVSMSTLLLGFFFAMWGYWGMFANRFARVIEQRELNRANDPFASDQDKSNQD